MKPAISFDRVADQYDATRAVPEETERAIQGILADRLAGRRTLEVGIGTGRILGPLHRDPRLHVVGVDVGPQMVRRAIGRGARRVVLGDARMLPFRTGAFEVVMSTHLLHLVPSPAKALREFARVATDAYLSVLEYETDSPDIHEEYLRQARDAGCAVDPPGLAERKLPGQLVPDQATEIAPLLFRKSASIPLAELERRAFRGQWAVPDDLHARIMQNLRSLHPEGTVSVDLRCVVASWAIFRILEFADHLEGETVPDPGDRVGAPRGHRGGPSPEI